MESNFNSLVNEAKSVLILLAKNPYLDQTASGLALYLALKEVPGKNVQIATFSPMMVEHNRLVGVDKVTTEPGNKNLVIKFSNYPSDNIERVSYDVDGSEFRLSVIPKPEFDPPLKDQVDLSYAGVQADLVILVGGMNISHFPLLTSGALNGAKIAHVGVQPLPSENEMQIISFAEGTASTSELMYQLILQTGANITQDIASNLLMGMQEGTRSFSHNRVTAQTFKVASDLMEKGASLDPRQAEEQKQYPAGAIPGATNVPFTKSMEKAENEPEAESHDPETEVNPPTAWLQPKIYKGGSKS